MLAAVSGMYLCVVVVGIYLSIETYRSPLNPVPVFLVPFYFFMAGTPLAYMLGYQIFSEVAVEYLADMVMICMVAAVSFMMGVALAGVLRSQAAPWTWTTARRLAVGIIALQGALCLVASAVVYLNWDLLMTFNKVSVVQDSSVKYYHYGYTTLMLVSSPLLLYLARKRLIGISLLLAFLGSYVV